MPAPEHVPSESSWTPQDIERRQEAAWSEAIDYAIRCSPFYRDHLRRAGIAPGDTLPLAERHRIPPIDKATLSRDPSAFVCVPREEVVDLVTTSGSTGQPLICPLTENDLQRLTLNERLSFGAAGLTASDTVLLAVTLDRCFMAGLAYCLGLRALGCATLRTGPATPLLHLELLERLHPTAVVGVPSFLARLADKADEHGFDLAGAGIRQIVCIGEAIRRHSFTLLPPAQRLAERWRARLHSSYGITELASSLCECPAGCGGHLHPGLLHLEVLDDAGHPVPDGTVGELTATTFGVEALPLIRYRTGDMAAVHRSPCACGQASLRLGPIVGRKDHKLKMKGVTLFPSTLQAVLDTAPGVVNYVIIARTGPDLSDDIEVRLVCAGNPRPVLDELRERFQGEARVLPRLVEAAPAHLESLQLPDGARKRRRFVDERH